MAHGFIKKKFLDEPGLSNIYTVSVVFGVFLLINSFTASRISRFTETGELFALVAAIILGVPLVYHAVKDLFTGAMEMNELAALSFTASFCTGQYRTAAFIAVFMTIAQLIEAQSQLGARKNIEALLKLSPEMANVIRNGTTARIEASLLNSGDLVELRPGDSIPGDGEVVEGYSTVDESTLTGESVPVEKSGGSMVYGGTTNITGRLVFRITGSSLQSTLAKIKAMIAQAEKSRTAGMKIVDSYAGWYTPLVLLLAAVVLFFTHDINRSIALLVISCPCIILLSGPTAIIAALSAAARQGVIIRDANVLERASRVDSIIFDKTGTLTHGRLVLTDVTIFNGFTRGWILAFAGSLARFSHHPAAKAILSAHGDECAEYEPVDRFTEIAGCGMSGVVGGKHILAGRYNWIAEACPLMHCPSETDTAGTTVHLAVDGEHRGVFQLADTMKEDAVEVVAALRREGIESVSLVSGDRTAAARAVAEKLGCRFVAEVMPRDKLNCVLAARKSGETVAVVGDGVNDAPALAAGDVGIAMGLRGCDVTVHSAGIVLANDRLNRLPFIFHLSRNVVSVIRQNLVFGTFFIVTMLVLSARGSVSPVAAAILHTASTLIVMLNSARLLKEKVPAS